MNIKFILKGIIGVWMFLNLLVWVPTLFSWWTWQDALWASGGFTVGVGPALALAIMMFYKEP